MYLIGRAGTATAATESKREIGVDQLSPQEQEALRQDAQDAVRALRSRIDQLDDNSLDMILGDARSHYAWTDRPVAPDLLEQIYHATAAGPTSMNTCPARFVYVTTPEGKARLAKSLKPANMAKMQSAPVTVIVAHDLDFWTHLPFLFPHDDRRPFFEGKPDHIEATAFRNRHLAGCLFHDSGARLWAGRGRDVRVCQRRCGRRILCWNVAALELPDQYRLC